ncbi:hypothetical protein M8J76_013878 [Diaphorina citri]|nr:hypothetical protein M8J76_013878 [Diaphorina citri]
MQNPGGPLNKKEQPKWRPMQISNPSTKLRQARSMPHWVTRDTPSSSVIPPPPPPPDNTGHTDPDYEVIEFPSQQYSNTEPVLEKVRKSKTPGRCDLCGSSIPTVKCEQCPSQHFCASCDDMYHRHPKRQHHARKPLGPPLIRPPLPPKGEAVSAPVPPPRRNKHSSGRSSASRFTPSPLSSQFQLSSSTHTLKKEPSGLIGSLKRFMGGRPLPPPPHMLSRDSRMSQPTLQMKNMEFQHDSNKPSSCDSGYLDWDSDRRTRSGSFSAINTMPSAFGVMGQAQSMAQLNCPSCLHHPPGGAPMGWNDWTSTVNLHHPTPLPGWSTMGPPRHNAWHGSQILPQSQFGTAPREEFSRRNSLRHSARRSRRDSSSERSEFRHRDDVRSRHPDSSSDEESFHQHQRGGSKHSRHGGRSSPAMSHRSRHPLSDIDSEGDTQSRRGGRRRRRNKSPQASPAMSRKSTRHSPVMSRHGGHSPVMSRRGGRQSPTGSKSHRRAKQGPSPTFSRRRESSASESELSSEMEASKRSSKPNPPVERQSSRDGKLMRPWSKSSKATEEVASAPEKTSRVTSPVQSILSAGDKSEGWECAHCTLVNPPGTTVCSVCCKTSNASLAAKSEEDVEEGMKKLTVGEEREPTAPNGKPESGLLKKGRAQSVDFLGRADVTSTGTSPPPQSISTQTYDYGGGGGIGLKRATSLADDVWRPITRSISRQSTLDSHSMATSPIPTPDIVAQDRAAYEFQKFPRSQSQQSQGLGADPPHEIIRPNVRRAGSQPPEYITTLVQNQVKQGMEMVKLLREAEQNGFTAEDLTIALSHCGDGPPVTWLINNWRHMIDTVVTLATNYGHERSENNVGTLSAVEARDALRLHNGNVWAAVTECFNDLMSRGNFTREDIVTVLTANHGNVESAYVELNKTQLKPFLMRIWGPPQGLDNDCGDVSRLHLEDDDIATNNNVTGEVHSREVSYMRDWLSDDTFTKQKRSKSMSELNQPYYYDDNTGDINAVVGNMQLRYETDNNKPITHRISTIYSSNVDLTINTEPMQYHEEAAGTRQGERNDSIDYIDEDDAESLTIRNTLHNEYVAAIVTESQFTNQTVNDRPPGSSQQTDTLQRPDQPAKSDGEKAFKTAFVPYLKMKFSGEPQETNQKTTVESKAPLKDVSLSNTTQKPTSTNKDQLSIPSQTNLETKTESKPSGELKYTNSFSGKNCKRPNVAKRKLTKSIKSVKKKVKSKLLGQKTSNEPEIDNETFALESPGGNRPEGHNIIPEPEINQNENVKTDQKASTVKEEESLKQNTESVKTKLKDDEIQDPSHIKPTSAQTQNVSTSLETNNSEQNLFIAIKNTQQINEEAKVVSNPKEVEKHQKVHSTESNESRGTGVSLLPTEKSPNLPNIEGNVPPNDNNEKSNLTKTVISKTILSSNDEQVQRDFTIDKANITQFSTTDDIQATVSNHTETKTDTHPNMEVVQQTISENKSLFQTKKSNLKAKNNKRSNKRNKKSNLFERKKINTSTDKANIQKPAEDISKSNLQEGKITKVTDVNFIDDKPKEKVTVEFEKDIIFVSDGETHKLIIKPVTEKIESIEKDDITNNEILVQAIDPISDENNKNDTKSNVPTIEKPKEQAKVLLSPKANVENVQISVEKAEIKNDENRELVDSKSKQELEDYEIEQETGAESYDEEEYTDDESQNDDVKNETSGTTESSNLITKQYVKPTNQATTYNQTKGNTRTESFSDDQYIDAKDTSSSSGKIEYSTDDNSDFLSVASEFSQLETFLNEMSVQPKSSRGINKNAKDVKTSPEIEVEEKNNTASQKVDDKKKAVQILTSKIAQIQFQEKNYMSNISPSNNENESLNAKINTTGEHFEPHVGIKIETPSTLNSDKEIVIQIERAGTSSSADVSSEILDSSSRYDSRDIPSSSQHNTGNTRPPKTIDESKLTMSENKQEILELLKQSLSNETVLEDIVNKLFSSVMGETNALNKATIPNTSANLNIAQATNMNQDALGPSSSYSNDQSKLQTNMVNNQAHSSNTPHTLPGTSNNLPLEPLSINVEQLDNVAPTPQSLLAFSPPGNEASDFEREVRRCLAEGLVSNYDQAELAVKLMRMSFDRELSVAAAKDCSTEQAALAYLQQECTLCAGKYPMGQMVSMLECEHHCCHDCALAYFTLTISERSINDCVCPFCKAPDLSQFDSDRALNYFSNLDILLKSMLDEKSHELFQRKLRDRTLMADPNFKWCTKCSSGYIADPRHRKFICPDCNSVTCAKCNRPWAKEHERKSCDEYSAWLELSDPNSTISQHLIENDGIVCPKCRSKYALAKGGCMHLTCPSCKYEFCSDCGREFIMGSKCTVSPYCEKLGLHSHHPRNCLFYLRDKDPQDLQKLLKDAGVEFKQGDSSTVTKCTVQLQRELNGELYDSACNLPVESSALCRTHYIEYLAKLIHQFKLDPVFIFELNELLQELRRRGKTLPERSKDASDQLYRDICIKIIQEEIPLE